MNSKKMVAMILAGGRGSRLYDLTKSIAKPAVHFGGKYRIIDFPLSNCANSNISTVGILVQYESILLNSYVSRDHLWGLDMQNGGVYVLPPREKDSSGLGLYRGTADAISQNIDFIDQIEAEYILILSGDHIYKMNYEKMLSYHIENKADATIAVLEVPLSEASRFGIMNVDSNDQIIEFEEKPANPKSNLASMGIYIFSYKTLRKYLKVDEMKKNSDHDFGKDIIPDYLNNNLKLMAYRFKDYWKDVGTIDSLWEANMDLLNSNSGLDLFDSDWKIYTEDSISAPHFVGDDAKIEKAYITQGCHVFGKLKNAVLFTGSYVEKDASVIDSVMMNNSYIAEGSSIIRCLVAEGVRIPSGVKLGNKNSKNILLVTQELVDKKVGGKK